MRMKDFLEIKPYSNQDVKECRFLAGVDTLYTFLKLTDVELYRTLWQKVNVQTPELTSFEFLNFSGKSFGFVGAWFRRRHSEYRDLYLYRVGFKNPDKQKNVHNIYVQLEAAAIYLIGLEALVEFVKKDITSLILNVNAISNAGGDSFFSDDDVIVSRADLNCFVDNYDFSQITAEMFNTRFRSSSVVNSEQCQMAMPVMSYDDDDDSKGYEYRNYRGIETLYLGSRSSAVRFKIYDKMLEIKSNKNRLASYIKLEFLKKNDFKCERVWNIEFSVKREVLKEYSVNTFKDFKDKCNNIFKDLMGRCSFLGFDVDKIRDYRNSNNITLLKPADIWQKILDSYCVFDSNMSVDRVYKSYKTNSKLSSIEKIRKELLRQIEYDQPFNLKEFMNIYNEVSRPTTYERLRI